MTARRAEQAKVSIVIPTYNRRNDLLRLLASFAKLNYSHTRLEIIVVDNASNLTETELRQAAGDIPLTLVAPPENLFCSGGRLFGARAARGDYLFFIDDDNVLAPDCIGHLVDAFHEDAKLGVAAPLMLFYRDKRRIWTAGVRLSALGRPIYLHSGQRTGEVTLPAKITGLDAFPNAFMVKRRVLEAVPFDVASFPHNWSEADFGLRLKRQGFGGATITAARTWHDIDYDGLLTRTDRVKVYDQAKSRILFRRRFSGLAGWMVFWLITFPVSSLVYLKAIWASPDKHKLAMIGRYIAGTASGIVTPLAKHVEEITL